MTTSRTFTEERKKDNAMNIQAMKSLSDEMTNVMPWLQGITSDEQYHELLALVEELIEDYDENQVLINLLFPVIESYEENAETFAEFNQKIESLDLGVAMLRVIIDQHQLTQSDFKNEIGGKSLVSLILKGERSLTLPHIRALSSRFSIPTNMFV